MRNNRHYSSRILSIRVLSVLILASICMTLSLISSLGIRTGQYAVAPVMTSYCQPNICQDYCKFVHCLVFVGHNILVCNLFPLDGLLVVICIVSYLYPLSCQYFKFILSLVVATACTAVR